MSIDPAMLKDWLFPAIDAGAGIATIVLVIFVWRQMRQTELQLKLTTDETKVTRRQLELSEHEIKTSLRPWVGSTQAQLNTKGSGIFYSSFTNYGSLPALNLKVVTDASMQKPSKDDIKRKQHHDTNALLLPQSSKAYTITVGEEYTKQVSAGKPIFLTIFIQYEYANNNRSEYGAIFRYDAGRIAHLIDEWTEEPSPAS